MLDQTPNLTNIILSLYRLFTHLRIPVEPYVGTNRSKAINELRNYGLFEVSSYVITTMND